MNRKLGRAYDLNNILLLEAEFMMTADFTKIKADFMQSIMAPSQLSTQNKSHSKLDLETCIQHFAKPEILDGDNKWLCNICKVKTEAIKSTYLTKEPDFLIIHLRRFKILQG